MTWLKSVALFSLLLAGGCAGSQSIDYVLSWPQVSSTNRYMGPELEINFSFTDETIDLDLYSVNSDLIVNWGQATFVSLEGKAVRVNPVGDEPIYTLPARARTRVSLTLGEWSCPVPRLWHRRVSGRKALVNQDSVRGLNPTVKLFLPVTHVGSDGTMTAEMLEFHFTVHSRQESAPGGLPSGLR